ncbi:DNA replication/repair protein RecF [Luteithermobacter gelatinilyticus]|uniref:DNA replication/repair protein RecF n=1 Tax=Luteithermobacter gelatinilyticus TaxID=2582913 RepID=UPI001AF00584|nr:DNA replication/repair protein RecF [Luteithermobacter gelatinilyticus]|tara:strand:+ start:2137 stop:3369 length:1233 start_codon:yes stop_codon:yes gene_type:complete
MLNMDPPVMPVVPATQERPRIAVERLMLTEFRSYARAELYPASRHVVFTGPNGAGKTNLLEAVSFLSPGRGLRGGKLSQATRLGAARGWAVSARLETPEGQMDVGTGLISRTGGASLAGPIEGGSEDGSERPQDRRIVRIDGETVSSPAVLDDFIQVIWLTPQMDGLFIEAASARRRFLDKIVAGFHPGHSREVNAYERVMRDRNRLLAEGASDAGWLAALEARMAEHGVAIAAARREALDHLAGAIAATSSSFPQAALALEGELESALRDRPAVEVEEGFRDTLARMRPEDSRAGRTLSGPHRTDLKVRHAEKDMPAELCSTGEQKALLLGLTLASARLTASHFGAAPLLLLDEVAAHLDERRRAALFDELMAIGAQVWLTGTDRALFAALGERACYYQVDNGVITEET